jgi:hypothetical protein
MSNALVSRAVWSWHHVGKVRFFVPGAVFSLTGSRTIASHTNFKGFWKWAQSCGGGCVFSLQRRCFLSWAGQQSSGNSREQVLCQNSTKVFCPNTVVLASSKPHSCQAHDFQTLFGVDASCCEGNCFCPKSCAFLSSKPH